MSLVTKTIGSRILGKEMKLAVYHPAVSDNIALPVLYFLHGRTGNESLLQWLGMEKTTDAMIEAGEIQPLIVVCPNLDNSRGINSSEFYREVMGKYGVVHKGRYEDECYFADEEMWLKNVPITIAKKTDFDDLQVFLDDGKEDEGQFYRACEKLYQLLLQNGAEVQNHLFEGDHSGEYIKSNMETYLRFYGLRTYSGLSE